jgi:hypothetical protein
MGILSAWREARDSVMKKELADIMARMKDANASARSAFLNNIRATVDETVAYYASANKAARKAFLRGSRNTARVMWDRGDWPSALGLGISCLNAESRHVLGEDAAYVKATTDRLVEEAAQNSN